MVEALINPWKQVVNYVKRGKKKLDIVE